MGGLKSAGKRRVARPPDEFDEMEGTPAEKQLARSQHGLATFKAKIQPSQAMAMINEHYGKVFEKYADVLGLSGPKEGRPLQYTKELCYVVVELLGTSNLILSERGIAARLAIPWSTWMTWKEKNSEFPTSIEMGMELQRDNMTNVGVHDRINVAGLIMAMKNNPHHKWRDKIEHDVGENMATLVRDAENRRRIVDWQDIGGYRDKPSASTVTTLSADGQKEIIDAEVREESADESADEHARTAS